MKIANLEEEFVACMDACIQVIGGIVVQDNHMVSYDSERKFKEHEKNYVTQGLERASIMHALKMSRHYLMGKNLR